MIDISNLDKARVLKALHDRATSQGLGLLHYDPNGLSLEQCRDLLAQSANKRFDYLQGRVLKIDLSSDTFDPTLYDRDNGEGKAQEAINTLQES